MRLSLSAIHGQRGSKGRGESPMISFLMDSVIDIRKRPHPPSLPAETDPSALSQSSSSTGKGMVGFSSRRSISPAIAVASGRPSKRSTKTLASSSVSRVQPRAGPSVLRDGPSQCLRGLVRKRSGETRERSSTGQPVDDIREALVGQLVRPKLAMGLLRQSDGPHRHVGLNVDGACQLARLLERWPPDRLNKFVRAKHPASVRTAHGLSPGLFPPSSDPGSAGGVLREDVRCPFAVHDTWMGLCGGSGSGRRDGDRRSRWHDIPGDRPGTRLQSGRDPARPALLPSTSRRNRTSAGRWSGASIPGWPTPMRRG